MKQKLELTHTGGKALSSIFYSNKQQQTYININADTYAHVGMCVRSKALAPLRPLTLLAAIFIAF